MTAPLRLVRVERNVWPDHADFYDEEVEPGTEAVYVLTVDDDTYEFTDAAEAHREMDRVDEARRAGRAVFPCSWTVERTDGYECDFPSDLYVPCGAVTVEDADGRGFRCSAGHSHRTDAEYFDDDELAAARRNGTPLPANAARMDGSPL